MAPPTEKHRNGNGYANNYVATRSKDPRNDLDSNPDEEYGGSKCRPSAFQVCANMCVFTGVYSLCGLVSSTLTSYVNSQVTTLERHFGFNSAQTGLIMAANDVGFLVVILFISYITAKVHIPRALGSVTVLFGISGIVCAFPYFIFGAPSPASSGVRNTANVTGMTSPPSSKSFTGQICDGINETAVNCDVVAKVLTGVSKIAEGVDPSNNARANSVAAMTVIVLGMVLQGVAKAPRVPFTATYVDANVERTQTGFYMGILTSISIIGPAMAYAVGGVFSRIYVTLEDTNLNYRHPGWIGAWWLGYVTFGVAACFVAIPLFCFPRKFGTRPGTAHQLKQPDLPVSKTGTSKRMMEGVKGFIACMLRLWTNPVYMCVVLSSCSLLFAVAGAQSFTPKYIENQFSFPAWKANMAIAGVMLCMSCVGTFVGGYLTKRFRMGPLASLKFTVATQTVSALSTGITMFFTCEQPYIYNSPGPRATSFTSLPGCHDACGCDDTDYFPVCGDDGKTFFSPCHAGCLGSVGGTVYRNCSCIAGGTATAGMCDYSCSMFYPYIIFVCCSSLFATFSIIPKLIIYIRAVEDRDKPLALGFNSFMTSITGWMLGPICFGKLIDDICIQWDKDRTCAGSGFCRLYDNNNFRFKLIGYQTAFRVLGLVFVVIALIVAEVNKVFAVTEITEEVLHVEMEPTGVKGDMLDKEVMVKPLLEK